MLFALKVVRSEDVHKTKHFGLTFCSVLFLFIYFKSIITINNIIHNMTDIAKEQNMDDSWQELMGSDLMMKKVRVKN